MSSNTLDHTKYQMCECQTFLKCDVLNLKHTWSPRGEYFLSHLPRPHQMCVCFFLPRGVTVRETLVAVVILTTPNIIFSFLLQGVTVRDTLVTGAVFTIRPHRSTTENSNHGSLR